MARDTDGERIPLLNSASSQGVALAQRVGTLLSNWWLWELIEACTSIIALAVIVVILFVYDGSSLPDWPSVFTVRQCLHPESVPSLMNSSR